MDDNTNEPSESDLKRVEKQLAHADKTIPVLRRKPKQRTEKQRERQRIAIASALCEFTDCYILVGYDVNGGAMVLINSANNMESRALEHLLEDFYEKGTTYDKPSGPSVRDELNEPDDL